MRGASDHRLRLVQFARPSGSKPAARAFATTVRRAEAHNAQQPAQANLDTAKQQAWESLTARTLQLYRGAKYSEAEAAARPALSITHRVKEPDYPGVATSLSNLALLTMCYGDAAAAEARLLCASVWWDKQIAASVFPSAPGNRAANVMNSIRI